MAEWLMLALLWFGLVLLTVLIAKFVPRIPFLEILADISVFILLAMAYLQMGFIADIFKTGAVSDFVSKLTTAGVVAGQPVFQWLVAIAGLIMLGKLLGRFGPVRAVLDLLPF